MPIVSLAILALVVGLLGCAIILSRSPGPLAQVAVTGDEVVVTLVAPVFLGFARRLSAPRSAVTGSRVIPAGTRVPLTFRLCGMGLPRFGLGWFWQRDLGVVYVARRSSRDAVQVDLAGDGRVRRWVVEVPSPSEAVAALME